MKVLVTGGTGYIGSHTCVELLNNNFDVAIIDNLSNSSIEVISRIYKITGKKPIFYNTDICNLNELNCIFDKEKFDAVIHFAALKSISESVSEPLKYYTNNVFGTVNVCEAIKRNGVKNIVLSSSAAVYGINSGKAIKENAALLPHNPYGRTKLIQEQIITDFANTNKIGYVILRYFNPIGAHKSGLIGENPLGEPSNLMPYISQVASGRLKKLNVFGNDYNTHDGTGVRDYIHVMDLALGHINALKKLLDIPEYKLICNIGSGHGYSVLDMIKSFESVTGIKINFGYAKRRAGDIDICLADTELAQKELGWKTSYNINDMCADEWNWQKLNPKGFLSWKKGSERTLTLRWLPPERNIKNSLYISS